MSQERLINYIIFLITDTMIEAYENEQLEMHDNLLSFRKNPQCVTYIYNWIESHKEYVTNGKATIGNTELHTLAIDGFRLAYAHYYNNDKMLESGIGTSEYAKTCREVYKAAIERRE